MLATHNISYWLLSIASIAIVSFAKVEEESERWHEPYGEKPYKAYYDCLHMKGCQLKHCATGSFYDEDQAKCVKDAIASKNERTKRQIAVVGSSCVESIDCRRGAYCDSTKRCQCLTTYTEINGYCWSKINPGEAGCTHNKQCSAVWPNAYCSSGTCKCANNAPAFETNDGPVCVNYGFCPVNPENTKYKDLNGNIQTCLQGFSFPFCPVSHDCFCSNSNCAASGVVTFCCPSRAMACIQELDTGRTPNRGAASVQRWYHNPITGNCETFTYRGDGGNANNFESKDQCVSYCKQACPRGNPQYLPYGAARTTSIKYCSGTSSANCDTNYGCTDVGTNSLCCPKEKYICSKEGGLSYAPPYTPPTNNFDPGSTGGNSYNYSRWYYDVGLKRCRPFNYGGYGGNFNNFLSETHCSRYCAKVLCDAGEPLRDRSGVGNLACSSSSTCPANYECVTGNVCCPRKQFVCSQPRAIGTCGNYVQRWWYNADTRNCELFTFSGCQGNDNNFATYTDCQNFCRDAGVEPKCPQGVAQKNSYGNYIVCGGSSSLQSTCSANFVCYYDGNAYGCCPTKAYTCSLSYDQGTQCGPSISRWYYNAATRQCETFSYNGCDGNSNNFATQMDCRDYCGVGGCPEGGEPFKEGNGQYRVCSGGNNCPNTHYCTQVNLGTSTTYNYCCPQRSFICGLPRDQGTLCGATIGRYFFNSVTRNCESFSYNGCEGNRNNYRSMTQCLNYCNSADCPAGQVALKDTGSKRLVACSGTNGRCPPGYSCSFSALLNQNICCGSSATGDTCPSGQNAYIDALTTSPLQCQPNVRLSCPAGYVCWYSASQNQYYCCGSSTVQCPTGGQPYIDPLTNGARQCTPGKVGACPTSYDCQATSITIGSILSTTGYCCGAANVCGTGLEAYSINSTAVECNPGAANTCPSGFQCSQNTATNQYFCCRPAPSTEVAVNVCQPYGEKAYIVKKAPVVCSTGSASTNCPPPYACRLYQPTNTFYCCRPLNAPVTPSGPQSSCPPGYSPAQQNGQYQYCSPYNQRLQCGAGGTCQFDSQQTRYICCTRSGGPATPSPTAPVITGNPCPGGKAVFTNSITRQPQSCAIGVATGCPAGYGCEPTRQGNFCCLVFNQPTATTAQCPAGLQSYPNPSTGRPQQCNFVSSFASFGGPSNCPQGYTCTRTTSGIGICCGGGANPQPQPLTPAPVQGDSYGCPEGNSFLYPGTSTPLACRGVGSTCPGGYTCRSSTRYPGLFQCCTFRKLKQARNTSQGDFSS